MSNTFLCPIRPLALLFALTIGVGGCAVGGPGGRGGKKTPTPDPDAEEAVPVEVTTIGTGRIEAVLRFSANLEAERQVRVHAEAPRRVLELMVEEGDQVAAGDQLARLQDDVQRSNLAKVESQLKRARREHRRQQELFAQKLISEQVFTDASYELEQLELALEDAQRDLSYTDIQAPIGGTVTERLVNVGDQITINQPLFAIVDFDSIVARIYVPEKELPRLAPGQPARVVADAIGSSSFDGSIDRIAPVVDPATGTVKVTVSTPRHPQLRPGMYVVVELVTAIHEDAILLPKRALVYDNDLIFAFRLVENRRIERLRVVPVIESGDQVEPESGFEPGFEVVVAGQSGLKDGALVKLPGDVEADDISAEEDQSENDGDQE